MYVIGLTGNIATGKSAVRRMLERLGAEGIDADHLAHCTMERGTEVWQEVVAAFGKGILTPEGQIDRKRLGAIVFSDPQALRRLERIVHPAVKELTWRLVSQAQAPVVVVEAIKLVEAGMHQRCHSLWVVTCRPQQQLERLMAKRGLSPEEVLARLQAQPPLEEKLKLADVVIDNSGSLVETEKQVKGEWKRIEDWLQRAGVCGNSCAATRDLQLG